MGCSKAREQLTDHAQGCAYDLFTAWYHRASRVFVHSSSQLPRPPGQDRYLDYLFVCPAVALLVAFTAYPFFLGIWLSLTDKMIGVPDVHFVGLSSFITLLSDSIFQQTFKNTIT